MFKFICDACHRFFYGYKNRNNKRNFCSIKCSYKGRKGSGNSKWVGIGKPYFHKNGGRYKITVNGKKMYYARYLMEKYLKRKILNSEIVHHKNGIKTDDRIGNLEVLTWSKHSKIHHPKVRYEKFCEYCRKKLRIIKSRLCEHKKYYCNKKCRSNKIKQLKSP